MKQNRYDDADFFEKYSQMDRSQKGLEGAGEWPALQALLPDFTGKRVLDLGCGYGWHCIYAARQGAAQVNGVDISRRMLEVARQKTDMPNVRYLCMPIEDIDFAPGSFDVVLSSLAFHYLAGFDTVCQKVYRALAAGGQFVFSVEHPVFTAQGNQDWLYGPEGEKLCWPVDRYFDESAREAVFLGERVQKYHRTLAGYLGGPLAAGFVLRAVAEPTPTAEMLQRLPEMQEELRRPMMLIVAAQKPQPGE